jgi:site-specific recombinase XerD
MSEPVQEYLDHLRAERAVSPHTLRAYGAELRSLISYLSPRSLLSASTSDLRGWLARSELAPSSLARRISCVKSFWRWAQREERAEHSPAERLRAPRRKSSLPRVLQVDEATSVVESAATLRDRALFEVAYGAGLRVSELVRLEVDDLQLGEGQLTVRRGKGGKDRVAPMGAAAVAALRALLAANGSAAGPVFLNKHGARLSTRSAWTIIHETAQRAGLPNVHPHALRHSFATHLLSAGADIRAIQEMLGHASLGTTQRYTQVDLEALQVAYRAAHPRARSS